MNITEYKTDSATIANARAEDYLPTLPDGIIGVTVTSLPYKELDGYSAAMAATIARETFRLAAPDGLAFVNFGHLVGMKERPYEVAEMFTAAGWHWHDQIVWIKSTPYGIETIIDWLWGLVRQAADQDLIEQGKAMIRGLWSWLPGAKGHFTPLRDPHLNNLWEPIFVFAKDPKRIRLNRQAIGVEYADPKNAARFKSGRTGKRCGGNVWFVPYETVQRSSEKAHKDMFPEQVVRNALLLADRKRGSLILDPCAGSGTVQRVAASMGYRAIGCEVNPEVFDRNIGGLV